MADEEQWVNAVITFTVPLEVAVTASKAEKLDAVESAFTALSWLDPDLEAQAAATLAYEDVNG